MKLSEEQIKQIIEEEITKITEEMSESEEKRISRYVYILLGEALEKVHDYLGELEDNVASEEFLRIFDSLAKTWKLLDKTLTGGETRDALPGIFENKIEEEKKSTKELTQTTLLMARDLKSIIDELVPTVKEIADREQFASADIDPKRPITVRPGTTEVPRLEEDEENE
jgi:hypothetical protein